MDERIVEGRFIVEWRWLSRWLVCETCAAVVLPRYAKAHVRWHAGDRAPFGCSRPEGEDSSTVYAKIYVPASAGD